MSAILSESQLNDFISPGVACIKPVETLPAQQQQSDASNSYEVTTEDRLTQQDATQNAPPAQISLTDCLACSGCVTSAEAVLVSLQSHEEVLNTLEAHKSLSVEQARRSEDGKVFVASVSPQARASLAATFGVSSAVAGAWIEQLLCGPQGLKAGGAQNSGFNWCLDTNRLREVALEGTVDEALVASSPDASVGNWKRDNDKAPRKPVLASACPGWICYAEKTHPHVLPHLSRLKSPQALAGTLVKSILSRNLDITPDKIWHLAIMPCFDKKLEASREELTDTHWAEKHLGADENSEDDRSTRKQADVRDVDCVITARELLMLAEYRAISIPQLPRASLHNEPFPDPQLDALLFPHESDRRQSVNRDSGPSGGYAFQILQQLRRQHPGSHLKTQRGRNPDVVEYHLVSQAGRVLGKTARYYGFQNIQNLVRKLKPAKSSRLLGGTRRPRPDTGGSAGLQEYLYVEVMACPGGCTNGGGQVKVGDLPTNDFVEGSTEAAEQRRIEESKRKPGLAEQKEWLKRVDEAYYSADSEDDFDMDGDVRMTSGTSEDAIDAHSQAQREKPDCVSVDAQNILERWQYLTGLTKDTLVYTTYRAVESDVGKDKTKGTSDVERVAGLASSLGGGW